MCKIAGGILLAFGGLLLLPYLLYWLLWFFTGSGLPPKSRERDRHAKRLAARRDLGFEDGWHDSHRRWALQGDRVPMGAMTTTADPFLKRTNPASLTRLA
jgi:hypothetical protein